MRSSDDKEEEGAVGGGLTKAEVYAVGSEVARKLEVAEFALYQFSILSRIVFPGIARATYLPFGNTIFPFPFLWILPLFRSSSTAGQ